jgi:ribosome-binding protein aMBF1 (putative translation factor)
MNLNNEFKKRCDICKKNRQARSYPFPVQGVYFHLCKECWNNFEKEVAELEAWLDSFKATEGLK